MIGIPPQVEQDRDKFPETHALFKKAKGRIFRIRDFDQYGHAELWLLDDGSESKENVKHSIWVEPEHLEMAT
jgi:hypothetical protein